MAPKSVTFRRHDHLVSVLLEICSAIPTTLHFQCFCILLCMDQLANFGCRSNFLLKLLTERSESVFVYKSNLIIVSASVVIETILICMPIMRLAKLQRNFKLSVLGVGRYFEVGRLKLWALAICPHEYSSLGQKFF